MTTFRHTADSFSGLAAALTGYAEAGIDPAFDADGDLTEVVTSDRFDTATGTGALGTPTTGIGARVSYEGFYYDLADRPTATVDVGTNGGSAWTMPTSVPTGSATVLVTSTSYAADAVQDVALTGGPTGGTFTLTFGGQTTGAIAYNATAATVQTALTALSSVGSGNVSVSTAPGGSGWEVWFTGTLAATYQTAISGSGSGLTGGSSPGVSVSTISAGGDAGYAAQVTDPLGEVTRTDTDAEGRTVRTVQDFTNGVVANTSNATTGYTYNQVGTTSITAYQTGGGGQTTLYVYGVTTATGSTIDSNDVAGVTEYPNPTTGAPSTSSEETTTVNALDQPLTITDRDGNVHAYTYDVLGRETFDAVTTLGTGVDGTVRLIETQYDGQGNPYLVTSYSGPTGGTIVNQTEDLYNGLGQLTADYQSVQYSVNTSSTPAVLYAYTEMSGGADNSRLTSVTYPDGYVLDDNYSSGLNSTISRLSSLSDSTGTLESYKYLGVDTVVERDHPQTGVNQTLISQTGGTGVGGDKYVGLDQFGRVIDDLWTNTSTSTTADEFQYGYDADGDVLYRQNAVNTSFGELYTYTGENQLATFARGTLNGTDTGITGTASATQSFVTNATGDFTSVTTNGTATTETANAQNEITGVSGATTPTYDANGNMTGDQNGNTFTYDAWNRMVDVKNSSGTTLETNEYDGLSRLVAQAVGGTTTDLYYSSQDQVLEEFVGGAAVNRYVWSPVYVNALVLRDSATGTPGTLNERLWVQQDANWNVTALVNGSGVVVERYAYTPFGVQTVLTASWSTLTGSGYGWVYLYQGMRYDATSGQYRADERWYNPVLQRWTTNDPTGFGGGDVNLDRFVANNPLTAVDPTGLSQLGDAWDNLTQAADGVGFRINQGYNNAYNWTARQFGYNKRGGVNRRIWIVATKKDDPQSWGAYIFHSAAATLDSLQPFGASDHVIRASSLEDAYAKMDARKLLRPNDRITFLEFAGHGNQGNIHTIVHSNDIQGQSALPEPQRNPKATLLSHIGTYLSPGAEIRINCCNVAQGNMGSTLMLELSRLMGGHQVTANDGWIAGTGTGQWYTTINDGTAIDFDRRWGSFPLLGDFFMQVGSFVGLAPDPVPAHGPRKQ